MESCPYKKIHFYIWNLVFCYYYLANLCLDIKFINRSLFTYFYKDKCSDRTTQYWKTVHCWFPVATSQHFSSLSFENMKTSNQNIILDILSRFISLNVCSEIFASITLKNSVIEFGTQFCLERIIQTRERIHEYDFFLRKRRKMLKYSLSIWFLQKTYKKCYGRTAENLTWMKNEVVWSCLI